MAGRIRPNFNVTVTRTSLGNSNSEAETRMPPRFALTILHLGISTSLAHLYR